MPSSHFSRKFWPTWSDKYLEGHRCILTSVNPLSDNLLKSYLEAWNKKAKENADRAKELANAPIQKAVFYDPITNKIVTTYFRQTSSGYMFCSINVEKCKAPPGPSLAYEIQKTQNGADYKLLKEMADQALDKGSAKTKIDEKENIEYNLSQRSQLRIENASA